ncbi:MULTISPECIES: hypothetical protein [Kosakonia]|uniref:DUF4051 domain-containing protein n=2 Tax=Kosakonia TaxID=1330547 RepID=A0AA94KR96_9ENTR|nr:MULTISPECIES: hypothetical protein [Kosakonia]MBS1204827.1 hypothetical protein [Pseudomonadota bacterium]SEK19937.1 Protein of unknown function [Kosakonia sacchari]KIS42241.1 hypothetical protein LG58_4621 [Kosakonia radicincitans YD4]MDD7995316.1 hypothetical protein [Kosakonia radicincitans]MDP9565550.1 hypothetical protein [Kosakonia oryzae]
MFISWYWLLAIVIVVFGYVHVLKRHCKACRHDREAIYKAYQRVLEELKKTRRVGQGE